MKVRLAKDIAAIDKLFDLTNIVQVPDNLFNDILKTYPSWMRAKFMLRGIEYKPGKFIVTTAMREKNDYHMPNLQDNKNT